MPIRFATDIKRIAFDEYMSKPDTGHFFSLRHQTLFTTPNVKAAAHDYLQIRGGWDMRAKGSGE